MIVSKYDIIKNYESLASTPERRFLLDMMERGFKSIEPDKVMSKNFYVNGSNLIIGKEKFDLDRFGNIYLIGLGKASTKISEIVERKLGPRLKEGYVIDNMPESVRDYEGNMDVREGDHPNPSARNYDFASDLVERFENNTTAADLFVVPVCGGGSSLLTRPPESIGLEKKIKINKELLKGLDIYEMNTVRKHVSTLKGGGLAKILYPATVASMIISDVPGNDISVIASGPTVKDPTTKSDAFKILEKYGISDRLKISKDDLIETPKNERYFGKVYNQIILDNLTPLREMEKYGKERKYNVRIVSNDIRGEANKVGMRIAREINNEKSGTVLLYGGETYVKVKKSNKGKGGRNQELVTVALGYIKNDVTIGSFGSDGWDYDKYAGAIGDEQTLVIANEKGLNIKNILDNHNSMHLFDETGDGIFTGKRSSNVADLMVLVKT